MSVQQGAFGKDRCIVCCGDGRIRKGFHNYLSARHLVSDDSHVLRLFGGAWGFAHGSKEVKDFLLKQVDVAVQKGAQEIILANHEDCGFYKKYFPAHPNTLPSHIKDVWAACSFLVPHFPVQAILGFAIPMQGDMMEEPKEVFQFPANRRLVKKEMVAIA